MFELKYDKLLDFSLLKFDKNFLLIADESKIKSGDFFILDLFFLSIL